ncbi:response regulator transcription factor [Sulfurimonas sp. MAG313]|nr:response regulator transcription factor [Sulfurimonas sp. MAG313]MDF1881104.1 response regulator transcription factor [Sulfurimonas sp. MAG313]
MRVLYLEDDETLSSIVKVSFKDTLIMDVAATLKKAKEQIHEYHYDIVLIDRNIEGQDIGLELIKEIKNNHPSTGVIVLSAYATIDDKIDGLELGADDYMEKPFNHKELHARIQALQRRNIKSIITINEFSFDISSKRIFENNKEVFLTNMENELLFYLLINQNKVISHNQLLQALYLHPEEISSNTINVRINAIRKKISLDFIKSIKTRGFILEV